MRVWKRVAAGGAIVAAAVALGVGAGSLAVAQVEDVHPGQLVYQQSCASCHDNPPAGSRTASLAALRKMSSEAILQALTAGSMKAIGDQLSPRQRREVAEWLAPAAPIGTAWIDDNRCPADRRTVNPAAKAAQAGFGVDTDNSRRMTAAQAGLKTADLANLEVAWAFAMPRTSGLRGQGVVVGDTVIYPAGQVNHLVALDTRTGCVKWAVQTKGGIRNSLAYGRLGRNGPYAVVGADGGLLAAFDVRDGREIWRTDPRHDRGSPISGSPLFAGDKIIVPISATDVATAMRPNHECCKTHGALAAVDAATGKRLWIWHTMEDAKPLGRKSSAGAELFGPSGAPIWSSPAADLKRGVAYASTGENTSPPGTKTSDAIVAVDLATGKEKWVFQALENDIWHMGCPVGPPRPGQRINPTCFFAGEGSVLRDHDFGAGPVIFKGRGGRQVILAGQKSGDVWALDAASGKVLWHQKFGEGTPLGGVHWGITHDGTRVFAPIADPNVPAERNAAGMYAIDVASGKLAWSWKAKANCEGERKKRAPSCAGRFGLSAAPLVIDGALVAGALDGRLYVWDARTGRLLAEHDTAVSYQAVNKIPANGGTIDAAGVFAGDGMLFVNSGYASFGQVGGNTLVAFRPKR